MLAETGPLLIASNHPNSFLDAVIVATLFKNPVYSLTRGDVFKWKLVAKILMSFNMLPVYRVSEGVENLEHNYTTFEACQHIFKNNGIVLIFSEGRCINEWHLRPLKKGTARLALAAWKNDTPLRILPLGINYSCFRTFGKNLFLNFGSIITKEKFSTASTGGKAIMEFNGDLRPQLQNLVFEITGKDNSALKKYFYVPQPLIKKLLLAIPAIIGYIFHFPLYYSIHLIIKDKAEDHYDSIMTGSLFFIYPFYILIITLVVFFVTDSLFSFFGLLLLPLTALALLHFKKQIN